MLFILIYSLFFCRSLDSGDLRRRVRVQPIFCSIFPGLACELLPKRRVKTALCPE